MSEAPALLFEVHDQIATITFNNPAKRNVFDAEVRERLVFGNAYLGAAPIVQALDAGADIVITGRVADAALFLGPLVHGLGWTLGGATEPQDLNRLAQGLTVGHLLECSGQGSGGNFGSQGAWKDIPDLAHIGYPIAEVWEDGTALITKAPGTGGRINFDTVRQQLLYEVHNPHAYHSPDVVLDMGQIELRDEGQHRVHLSGAQGCAPGPQLKVVAGYRDGYKAEVTWGFSWPDAWDKAQAAQATIRTLLKDKRIPHDELFVEYPGLNSAHGALAPLPDAAALNAMNEIMQDYRNDIGADLVFDKVETESQDVVHRRALADKDKSLITFGPVPNWVKLFAKSRFECGKLGNPKCPYVLVITGDCCCRCRIPEIIIDDGIRTLRRVPHKKEATTLVGKMEMELTQKMGLALSNDIASKRFKCLDGVTGVTAHLAKKD